MFNRNNVVAGFVLGILLPVVAFVLLYQIFSLLEIRGAASGVGLSENFRMRTLAIVAMAVNVLPMRILQKRRWEESVRGIVVATAALALGWVFYFGRGLF